MVEFYVIVPNDTRAILKMRQRLRRMKLDVLDVTSFTTFNEYEEVCVFDCFGQFRNYVRLRCSNKWTVTSHDGKISLIA